MESIAIYKSKLHSAIQQQNWVEFCEILHEFENNIDIIRSGGIEKKEFELLEDFNNALPSIDVLVFILENSPNAISHTLGEIYRKHIIASLDNVDIKIFYRLLLNNEWLLNKEIISYIEREIEQGSSDFELFDLLFQFYVDNSEYDVFGEYGTKQIFKYAPLLPENAMIAKQIYDIDLLMHIKEFPFIDSVRVQNFHCINDIAITNIGHNKEIYFLGENGVGKTLLLQVLVLATVIEDTEKILHSARQLASNAKVHSDFLPAGYDNNFNIFAYGVSRLRHHDSVVDESGYGTLFDRQSVNLTNPINFLKEIERKELKGLGSIKLSEVIKMMTHVLNIEDPNEIRIEAKGADFVFYERNTEVKFEHLADGYRSILLVLADLLSRLIENQPYITQLADFRGVVLIDEVDMLLHPKWAYCIVQKLTSKFKNIQWFFTTHSPSLVMGASKDAVFYRLYKENGKTEISRQYKYDEISDLLSNSILTSPLFDMEYSGMREQLNNNSIDVDTSNDYLSSRIHKQIKQRIAEQKTTNSSSYISDELINRWIAEALAEGGE